MKPTLEDRLIRIALYGATIGLAYGVGMSHASAANAGRPYSNIDRSVDAGNDTGDSRIDQLNQQQLDKAKRGYDSSPDTGQGYYGAADNPGSSSGPQRGYAYRYPYPYPPPYPPYVYRPPPVYVGPYGLPYGWVPWWRSPRYRANFYPYFFVP